MNPQLGHRHPDLATRGVRRPGPPLGSGEVIGFQLWLPTQRGEDCLAFSQYVPPEDVPVLQVDEGRGRRRWGPSIRPGRPSPIVWRHAIDYLVVKLQPEAQ